MRIEVNLQKKIAIETENQTIQEHRLHTWRDLVSAADPLSLQVLTAITEPGLYVSYNLPSLKITVHTK